MQEIDKDMGDHVHAIKVLYTLIENAFGLKVELSIAWCDWQIAKANVEAKELKDDATKKREYATLCYKRSEFEALRFHLYSLEPTLEVDMTGFEPYVRIYPVKFRFPNSHARWDECIKKAFEHNGQKVADISRNRPCWTYVLTEKGDLWLHDTSHGCGGEFNLIEYAKR